MIQFVSEADYRFGVGQVHVECRIYNESTNWSYLRITDIAKLTPTNMETADVIANWLRQLGTIKFMIDWELEHNPDFNLEGAIDIIGADKLGGINVKSNLVTCDQTKSTPYVTAKVKLNPKRWIEKTNAIGLIVIPGRYGGTYAHSTIALRFAISISEHYARIILERYQELMKQVEHDFSIRRDMARNMARNTYPMMTGAIAKNILPTYDGNPRKVFATEADMLNDIVFHILARDWRATNPELAKRGNIRDDPAYADAVRLALLDHLQRLNTLLLNMGVIDIMERYSRLSAEAEAYMQTGMYRNVVDRQVTDIGRPVLYYVTNPNPPMTIGGFKFP